MYARSWVLAVAAAGLAAACSGDGGATADTEGGTDGSSSSGATDSVSTTGTSGADTEDSGAATSSTSSATTGNDSAGTGGSTTGSSETDIVPVDCPADALAPGEHADLEIEFGGATRVYDLFVPTAHDGSAALPLVLNMHGFLSNKAQQASFSGMTADAEARGVIVAYPQGIGNSWNGGACCGTAADTEVDDVGFVRAVVEQVQAQTCVDPTRVYATGMSNGGFMSHRLACEAADVFAAVAPVAGVLGIPPEDCIPSRPIPLIHFHGTADTLVAYDGSQLLGYPGVVETAQGWADRNGCAGGSQLSLEMDDVTCETWNDCADGAEVTLCTIEGHPHCWPGQSFCPFGGSSTTISANLEMFDFFEKFTL